MSGDTEQQFDALLEYLKRTRGFDFSAYKRAGLMRRVQRRLQVLQIESFADYLDYLEVHPDEFSRLFNTILINVTAFFRDPPVWDYVAETVLPKIIESKSPGEPVRVWSAGCASGEEAYTLAMLLAQRLGMEQFRERVKIYASNVDEDALNKARLATYTAKEVEPIPSELLVACFELQGERYVFHKDLRRALISAGTTWSRTRRSRGSTCSSAAIR
jgi:two-component system CheB/CheR fusion protein